MAVDMFLKLDGIDGESSDHAHESEIDLLSFTWGASNSGTMHIARGGGAGKVSVQDLTIVKYVDKATPALVQAVSVGKHIASGTLTCRKAGGDEPVEFLVIELENILVSSWQTGGAQGEERSTETFSLNFGEFKVTYTPQDNDGSPLASVDFGYNIARNEPA
ncbi:type VI secretion system tube protein Hcp [Halomonas campisalis]|uniref:Type VI secretion system tube protein Hcp n=1 Tax=Billgrantia campisalis TaxID=74661 RepID=A0ABS9P6U1_9GAMM|nr:type VI secretion system tube protein Hcp [Halomonas campisalis]MCG6657492.1 type VI secretion system tube protein Hcp [Halomonas campisalis]MDR5863161.1 type VI secretion system tube protein Hcp [Halomonas campisalis]